MGDKSKGLVEKYKVTRVDGKDPGLCIVLPLDDENSWNALLMWAHTVEKDGYEVLAAEVRQLVNDRKQAKENNENV